MKKLKILIIIVILINVMLFIGNMYKYFPKEDENVIYCVSIEKLIKERNIIDGMKCSVLKFDYELMKEDFYEYLLYNNTSTMICNLELNYNECNHYDDYFYREKFINDSDMVGYFSELVGIDYNSGNYSKFKKTFFKESEEVDYEESYRRLKNEN